MIEMFKGVANSPETTITNDINNTDTLIYVLDETRIPEELPNLMVLGTGTSAETIKVLSIDGNAITVERGFQGTPRSWNAGTIIARNFTEYDYNALVENVKTLKGNTDTNAGDILSLMNYVGNLENLDTVEKSNIVLALNEIYQDLMTHKAENATDHATYESEIIEIKKKMGIVHNVENWAEVQAIVRAGIADQVFSIGDMLVSKYNGKEEIWIVIGINHDTPTDSSMTYSMTIQTLDCLDDVQFDAPEPTNPDANRQEYGNNRYIHSAIKQWLNSNDDTFQWVSQHEYDEPPTGSIYEGPGFLKLLDPELVTVIGAVDKQVARNTVTDGGGQDTFSDKIFLLSRVEVYGDAEGDTTGEEPYPYYLALASSPTTGALAGRIKLLGSSPRYWWLRSPGVGGSGSSRYVSTTGTVNSGIARNAFGASPACCII